jgi:hypothetical protein
MVTDNRLMLKEGNQYLSLAIPVGDYSPNEAVLERLQKIAKTSLPVKCT